MKVYCLNFIRGEYDSFTDTDVGIYTSEEKREEALARCRAAYVRDPLLYSWFEENGHDKGQYVKWEAELDSDLTGRGMC